MLVMGTKEKSKKKEEEEAVADKRIQNDLCRMSELIDQQNVLYDAAPSKKLQITGWEPVNDRSLGIPESLSSSQPLSPAPSEKAISTLYTSQESFEKLSRADTIVFIASDSRVLRSNSPSPYEAPKRIVTSKSQPSLPQIVTSTPPTRSGRGPEPVKRKKSNSDNALLPSIDHPPKTPTQKSDRQSRPASRLYNNNNDDTISSSNPNTVNSRVYSENIPPQQQLKPTSTTKRTNNRPTTTSTPPTNRNNNNSNSNNNNNLPPVFANMSNIGDE